MDDCWQPTKELSSNSNSQDTMTLEEDEMMSVSSNFTEFGSYCLEENFSCYDENDDDDDDISCSTIQSDADDTHDFYYSENASRVKFAKMATKYLIMSLNEFTPEEIEDTWWTPNQREVLNKAHNKTVDRLEAGLKEKKSSPYRGLEKITDEGYQRMVEAKNAYVDTVMDEMERQWTETDNDTLDWEQIASLTREISKQSTQEALTTALYDEDQAREAYQTIKVKDLQELPQMRPSISSISDLDGSSAIMAMLDDDASQEEAINKLMRLDSSLHLIKEKGLVSPKNKKKAKGNKKKKKKTKTSKNKEAEEGSASTLDGDGSLTEVEFDDDSGVFGSIEGGEFSESGDGDQLERGETDGELPKEKKRRSRKKKAKKEEATTSDTPVVVVKKKKRRSSKKTASMEDDSNFLLTKKNIKDAKKKNPVSRFATTCVQRIRARAA